MIINCFDIPYASLAAASVRALRTSMNFHQQQVSQSSPPHSFLPSLSIPLANSISFAEGRETKKRTTLARLLKGLKTVNRRDRNNQQNGAQARVSLRLPHPLKLPLPLCTTPVRQVELILSELRFYDRKQIVCPFAFSFKSTAVILSIYLRQLSRSIPLSSTPLPPFAFAKCFVLLPLPLLPSLFL